MMISDPAKRLPFPVDLAVITGLTITASLAMTVPGIRETPLRLILGIPYLTLVPGYALVSALFPEADGAPVDSESDAVFGGIDGLERVALSFGLSVLIVPLLGLGLNITPWGLRLLPIVLAVSCTTLVLVVVAAWRRAVLDPADRFQVSSSGWFPRRRDHSRTGFALDLLLVATVLLATVGAGYVFAAPGQGEQFTEFYLVTEDDTGAFVADGYPTNFTQGETKSLSVGVENHEGTPVRYTVVTQLQRVERVDGRLVVRERTELDRTARIVDANETWRTQDSVTPTMTGDRLRLTYLLYRDSVPQSTTVNNAYQEIHLWINVTA